MQSNIEQTLTNALTPIFLDVINESHKHNVPKNSETHFKVTIVSDKFENLKLIERHRQVNTILKDALKSIHALSIHTYTKEEWDKKGGAPSSPLCRGGSEETS